LKNWNPQPDRQPYDAYDFRGGGVYIIRIGRMCKIGLSFDPYKRIQAMQLPVQPEVLLVVMAPKPRQLEDALHRRFAAYRRHGEWFELDDEALAEAQRIALAWQRILTDEPKPSVAEARIYALRKPEDNAK